MNSHATLIDEKANMLLNLKKTYAGPVSLLSHRQAAAAIGLKSLPLTTSAGVLLGAALGFAIGVSLVEDESKDSILPIFAGPIVLGALGCAAGVPVSYKLYHKSFDKIVQLADKRVATYARTFTPEGRIAIKPTTPFEITSMQSDIFQSNEQSFRNFMNILNEKVETE